MKKLIDNFRKLISRVDTDVKDHLLVAFLYKFIVVLPCFAYFGENGALISIVVGVILAILWEFVNKKTSIRGSVKDVLIFVLSMLPLTLIILN